MTDCREEFITFGPGICVVRLNGTKLPEEGTLCNGDSGSAGGVVRGEHFELDGVVSFGDMPCERYAVYTPVADFVDWIEANTEGDVWQ